MLLRLLHVFWFGYYVVVYYLTVFLIFPLIYTSHNVTCHMVQHKVFTFGFSVILSFAIV